MAIVGLLEVLFGQAHAASDSELNTPTVATIGDEPIVHGAQAFAQHRMIPAAAIDTADAIAVESLKVATGLQHDDQKESFSERREAAEPRSDGIRFEAAMCERFGFGFGRVDSTLIDLVAGASGQRRESDLTCAGHRIGGHGTRIAPTIDVTVEVGSGEQRELATADDFDAHLTARGGGRVARSERALVEREVIIEAAATELAALGDRQQLGFAELRDLIGEDFLERRHAADGSERMGDQARPFQLAADVELFEVHDGLSVRSRKLPACERSVHKLAACGYVTFRVALESVPSLGVFLATSA